MTNKLPSVTRYTVVSDPDNPGTHLLHDNSLHPALRCVAEVHDKLLAHTICTLLNWRIERKLKKKKIKVDL